MTAESDGETEQGGVAMVMAKDAIKTIAWFSALIVAAVAFTATVMYAPNLVMDFIYPNGCSGSGCWFLGTFMIVSSALVIILGYGWYKSAKKRASGSVEKV